MLAKNKKTANVSRIAKKSKMTFFEKKWVKNLEIIGVGSMNGPKKSKYISWFKMIKNGLILILCFRRIGNIKVGSIRYKTIYSIQYTHTKILPN